VVTFDGLKSYSRVKNSVTSGQRTLKLDGTLWVMGTHHTIFSLSFAFQSLDYRVSNNIVWSKPNSTPNAPHTAFSHWKAVARIAPAGASCAVECFTPPREPFSRVYAGEVAPRGFCESHSMTSWAFLFGGKTG
jgi:hypothetical protein